MKVFTNRYIPEIECYDLMLTYKGRDIDTDFRIDLLSGDFLLITSRELKALKELLNSDEVTEIIG